MKYSDDIKSKAKDIFVNNPDMTLEKLSKLSQNLLGQKIELEIIKVWSKEDSWHTQRNQIVTGPSVEVEHIRQIVYRQIVAASEGGILITGEAQMAEIEKALSGIKGIEIVQFNPNIDPQLINSYMNLLSKSNVKVSMGNTSAKTSRQQALELISGTLNES